MRKLLFFLVTAIMLSSCGKDYKSVRLPNGALVKALNTSDIYYGAGAKVCVQKAKTAGYWLICTDGEMHDTTYTLSRKVEGVNKSIQIIHKVGTVSNHL